MVRVIIHCLFFSSLVYFPFKNIIFLSGSLPIRNSQRYIMDRLDFYGQYLMLNSSFSEFDVDASSSISINLSFSGKISFKTASVRSIYCNLLCTVQWRSSTSLISNSSELCLPMCWQRMQLQKYTICKTSLMKKILTKTII